MAQNIRSVFGVLNQVGDTVEIPVSDAGSVMVAVAASPTPNATLAYEILNPAGEWVGVALWNGNTTSPSQVFSEAITSAQTRQGNVPNASTFRVRCTAFTSPTAVTITACEAVISVPPMLGATQRVGAYNANGLNYTAFAYNLVSANSANENLISAGVKYLTDYEVSNSGAAVCYVKLYNKATAPTSSDTPFHVIMVPAGGRAGMSYATGLEKRFNLGLGIRIVTGAPNNDTGIVALNQVTVSIGYN